MPTATYEIDTHFHLDEIKSILIDFRNYPQFLSNIEHLEVQLDNLPIWEVRFVLQLIRRMQYELRLQLDDYPDHSVLHWSLLEGVFQSNTGKWRTHTYRRWYNDFIYDIHHIRKLDFRIPFQNP